MSVSIARTLVGLLAVAPLSCHAYVPNRLIATRSFSPRQVITTHPSSPLVRRAKDTTALKAVADYSGAARALFGNIISPAALLAGGLVPLGFLAQPLPGNKTRDKRLRSIYWLLAVLSLANELTAIVYATVASNKLTEIAAAPASSVFALIQRDYELSWIATNVHFLFGLFGFLSMIGLRAFTNFPCSLNRAAAGIVFSALLGMCSVVNRGVSAGDGTGHVYGSSIVTLVFRYFLLLAKQVRKQGGIMAMAAIALGLVSTAMAVRAVIVCDSAGEEESA